MSRIAFPLTAKGMVCCTFALASIAAAETANGQEARSAAAHQHGTIEIEIAAEGSEFQIALYAPGADIVGFEHTPSSEADKQAVENARQTLSNPTALFGLPDAAGCAVEHASVLIATETAGRDDDDHDHDHAKEHKRAHDHEAHEHDAQHPDEHDETEHDHAGAHLEFIAAYHLDCADIGAVNALTLGIFDLFPNTQSLSFTILSDASTTATMVERDQASLTVNFGG